MPQPGHPGDSGASMPAGFNARFFSTWAVQKIVVHPYQLVLMLASFNARAV